MFTGIIQAMGQIAGMESRGGDVRLKVMAPGLDFSACALGDSIAVNGVCLTAVELGKDYFVADCSRETLQVTTLGKLKNSDPVNLEKALCLGQPLGGHLVSGHVDGVGQLLSQHEDARSVRLEFRMPRELARYVAKKGSICVNGVSLTVNDVRGNDFEVNIVPHTLKATTLGRIRPGDPVNLEVDLVARYLERLVSPDGDSGSLDMNKLRDAGFIQ
jgi:riboflavin synthase